MTVSFFHRIRVTPTRQSSVLSSRRTSVNTPDNLDETTTAASSAPLPTETPRSRESFEDFTRRLGGLDPMEGPSWLFSDDSPSSNSRQSQSTKPRDEKRQENSLKARLSSASRKISLDEDSNETENNEPPRPKKGKSSVDKETKNVTQSENKNTTAEENSAEISRPRRGAAQAARSSLKEQPINTKLRQGDPASKSVYDDFVPGSKRQSDRKSGKSAKNKRKKSDDPKKEDNNKK